MPQNEFPLPPPIEPMLARVAEEIPPEGAYLYEPKWDGFRAIVFRGKDETYIQSRDMKPLDRYFPELNASLAAALPAGCIVDGEIVIVTAAGLDFDALQMRLHPAESRVKKLAASSPASFVAFDLLAVAGESLLSQPQAGRRKRLEKLLAKARPPLHLTPITRERKVALDWLQRFEGAGLDGVIAKLDDAPYLPGKRTMLKIKHVRTADCVIAGFRWHKAGEGLVGSLLLGLYDDAGTLHHVGAASAFTMKRREELAKELEPLRKNAMEGHPWSGWAEAGESTQRMPGAPSRWSQGKDASWHPLRIERVAEVKYDHLQVDRFRHAAQFLRWRPDKPPEDCRYDQLEVTAAFELKKVFAA